MLHLYQKSVGMPIPLLPFSRLVCELADNEKKDLWFQSLAIKVLQEGAEDAQLCKIHAKCKTVMPKDITLTQRLW